FLTRPVSLFRIDRETYGVLKKVEEGEMLTAPFEEERWAEAQTFMERHCLNAPPARLLRGPGDISERVMGLYLFISQECNLRCAYCYGDEGEYGQKGTMGSDTLRKAFETFFDNNGERSFITFFGGEPLLNPGMMKETAALSEEYRQSGKADISLGIVTNGTIYSEEMEEFFRNEIDDVTFSLDGPREINDGQRKSKAGFSVYDRAEENIRKYTRDGRFNWAFRTIVTSRGCDRVQEIFDHLSSFGPGGVGVVNVDAPKDSPLYLDDHQYREFIDQTLLVNRKGLRSFIDGGQPVAIEYPFYILFHFISKSHSLYHCNAGTNLLAVTAGGDVYPCHRFVGVDEFRMGNVSDPGLKQTAQYREIRRRFIDSTVDNRDGCRDCWARYLCGGSCAKYSHSEHGSINPPVARHCLSIKTSIEEIIPDIARVMEAPEQKDAIMERLKKAVSHRHGSRSMEASYVP
ncbi:MAG: SPASM domain-containing protein, partial [Thermodesulfovibrionales bacterium]